MSNILDRKTPLLAGYPSASISKQKVRRVRLSGLLRPRIVFNKRQPNKDVKDPKIMLVRGCENVAGK